MACPGPALRRMCSAGPAAPVVPLRRCSSASMWVAEHLVEVIATSAVCGALAVAAVALLMRWADRRDARQRAAASIWTVRPSALPADRREAVGQAERAALPFRDLHIHLDGMPSPEQAAVIRQALNEPNASQPRPGQRPE